jgi:hypothetical protein
MQIIEKDLGDLRMTFPVYLQKESSTFFKPAPETHT